MKFMELFLFMLVLSVACSCNDYEKVIGPALKNKLEDKNLNPIFDGVIEPQMPNPKDNDKTLLGADSNNNGIRDDIDIWINRTGKNYNERMALRQYAIALRERWIVGNEALENFSKGPINTKDTVQMEYFRSIGRRVQEVARLEANATMGCMNYIFVLPDYSFESRMKLENDLRVLYNNTKLRNESYDAYYQYNHTYGVTGDKKNGYEYCSFPIENLPEVISKYENNLNIQRQERLTNEKK